MNAADTTTCWDGRLSVEGGRLVLPDHVGPEVVAMDSHGVQWRHVTHSFGEIYGSQRGGVEVSVCGATMLSRGVMTLNGTLTVK